MTKITLDDFSEFFAAVHCGATPFPWQIQLVKDLMEKGSWPTQIGVPTASGKTSIIDAHVFAVAAMADGTGKRVPRRLTLVVPRRVLVDNNYDHALYIAELLSAKDLPNDSAIKRIADALRQLRWEQAPVSNGPLIVSRLRGGMPPPRSWRDDPTACAVLSCTPYMWGSRLLLRGYGSSNLAWPREAGLLAMDSVAVVDEAHLCRQLITSARSVASLEDRVKDHLDAPTLRVVEMTATLPDPVESALELSSEDFNNPLLSRRLLTPKPVEIIETQNWPAGSKDKGRRNNLVKQIVDEVISLYKDYGNGNSSVDGQISIRNESNNEPSKNETRPCRTIGVFVNTVSMATDVASQLKNETVDGKQLEVVLVCGRLRNYDLENMKATYPNLFSVSGNDKVDILVTTQSLEAGVDIDLAAAVSELAPASALAQRAGRVNRLGLRDTTRFVVLVPKDNTVLSAEGKSNKKNFPGLGPYDTDELYNALTWLKKRVSDPEGLGPQNIYNNPPQSASSNRLLYQRMELADSWWLARSSDDLEPAPELDLWLSETLDRDKPEVGVIVRRELPESSDQAIELLTKLPPQEYEVFPALANDVNEFLINKFPSQPVLLVRDSDVRLLYLDDMQLIRPSDIIVFDDKVKCFTSGVFDPDGEESASDVLACKVPPQRGEVNLRIEDGFCGEKAREILDNYAKVLSEDISVREGRHFLADLLCQFALDSLQDPPPIISFVVDLLRNDKLKDCDVVTIYDEDDKTLIRVLVVDQRSAVSDDYIRQTWTRGHDVLLEEHANAVANRARYIAMKIGLGDKMAELLAMAGLHHDDGKADTRFQSGTLGNMTEGVLLAKSNRNSTTNTLSSSLLPIRWRHEQASILRAWKDLDKLSPHDRDLVARLIGTSHGYGRVSFPHTSSELEAGKEYDELASWLFDKGYWDEIIQQTERRFGVWACAFLEAVLRAADGQVSGEGS